MIVFETLRWKNFLSTGDQWTEIQLNESPSTLIVGTNGAGKSTMLDALCFALFNKPFRKINRGQLVNSINEKSLKVEVIFSIGKDEYRVFRGVKPNLFEVYKNNKMVDQDAATKDTQKYLEQSILKLNFKSFTQVVILGSSTFVPFMQLGATVRREVIEDLLDIKIFSYMNTILKDRVRNEGSRNKETIYLKNIAEERVSSQERLINSLKEVNVSRQQKNEEKYSLNESKIKQKETKKKSKLKKLDKIEQGCGEIEKYRTSLQGLRDKQTENKTELRRLTKEITFLETNDECPTCTQVISDEFKGVRMASLTNSGSILTKDAEELTSNIDDVLIVIDKIEKMCEEMHELRSEVSSIERDVDRLHKENLEIDKEKKVKNPKVDEETKILETLTKELRQVEDNCAKISQTIDEFQVVSTLLKDSGIKKQVIKKYIPIFNNLINKYLNVMDFFVNFTLDEEFNEVIKSRFRDEFSYASFSEGEKQKIDLALLFTWREVARMKNSAATNLLILDEVFDSSLDASATSELLSILLKLGGGTNLFVISHKGDLLIDKFKRCLRFEKVNDFSKLIEEE